MIEFDYTDVYGWKAAVRGMRNPLESWAKSDSCLCAKESEGYCDMVHGPNYPQECHNGEYSFCMGKDDYKLMNRLARAGTDHGKALRFIQVWVDITAPLYWWKEFDTYRMGVEKNSCSTMHKIQAHEFGLKDFSHEQLNGDSRSILGHTIGILNKYRVKYNETGDKSYWWQMIQTLPTCYNQKRTVMMSYAAIRHMYHARKNHKLDEWHKFCEWAEGLPYSGLITEDPYDKP